VIVGAASSGSWLTFTDLTKLAHERPSFLFDQLRPFAVGQCAGHHRIGIASKLVEVAQAAPARIVDAKLLALGFRESRWCSATPCAGASRRRALDRARQKLLLSVAFAALRSRTSRRTSDRRACSRSATRSAAARG
jgi:hypothetical protein